MDELIAQLLVYIKGVWKYRWLSVAVAWFVALMGWFYVYQMPDNYEASARIYVDTQSILRPLMAGMTVSPNPEQQVTIMSRTLISRPNVERIIRMVDLDGDGDLDLLIAGQEQRNVVWLENPAKSRQ